MRRRIGAAPDTNGRATRCTCMHAARGQGRPGAAVEGRFTVAAAAARDL